jgi:hypothetical protein
MSVVVRRAEHLFVPVMIPVGVYLLRSVSVQAGQDTSLL